MKYSQITNVLSIIIIISIIGWFIANVIHFYKYTKTEEENIAIIKPNIPEFFEKGPREGLLDALKYYDIKDPEIVYCMAYLETGNFHSRLCLEDNNLLGLYNSKENTFFKFENWIECIKGYKTMVEYKRNKSEDIYTFLTRITYAEDPDYINKLKYLHNELFN